MRDSDPVRVVATPLDGAYRLFRSGGETERGVRP